MSRCFFALVFAILASIGNAVGQSSELNDNACGIVMRNYLIRPISAADLSSSLKLCNSHPRQDECLQVKNFIEKHGKIVPGLICPGASSAGSTPLPATNPNSPIYKFTDGACGLVATFIAFPDRADGVNVSDMIKLCNENKESCRMIQVYLDSRAGARHPPDLTCE